MSNSTPKSKPKSCAHPRCRGRHCAGGEHRPHDMTAHDALRMTTEARLHTR